MDEDGDTTTTGLCLLWMEAVVDVDEVVLLLLPISAEDASLLLLLLVLVL